MPSAQSLHLTREGSLVTPAPPASRRLIAKLSLRRCARESNLAEFLVASWYAGLSDTTTISSCSTVSYYGCNGEEYIENSPAADKEDIVDRERALKFVLVVVGLLFCAGIYPLILMARQEPALAMMMSLYATLGIFLLRASRNPSAHGSLIAFTAWSSFAHATIMGMQAFLSFIARGEFLGVAIFILIGVALIALAPTKQSVEQRSSVAA